VRAKGSGRRRGGGTLDWIIGGRKKDKGGKRKEKGRERQRGRKRVPGLDEKGPNLFSGRPSTPPPAKRLTTVWPSSYNPYYPKRTERPPPPSEERVERPEQKLRGGQSTGEACILSHQALPAFSVLLL